MAVSVEHFIDSLETSGLVTPAQLSALRDETPPGDAQTIASDLVNQGLLTQYQADAICTGRFNHLVLGDYTILDRIGEGGMGQVFKALHRRLDRFAAIKILSDSALHDRRSIERFHQEVRTAAQITHPNIVITYDASEQNGIHYLVMEYVDGQDVATVLEKNGTLSVSQAIDVILQTARGLAYAHSRRIIHRDIKPGNLLLDHQGNVKILDMGLARITSEKLPLATTAAERLTNAGQVMGTLDFMPPEQAENAQQADERSDIYSLGCTLYLLLVGRVPYPAESFVESIMAHREAPVPSLRARCPNAPEWLEEACRKCMNKRPDDRYQSVTELMDVIERNLKPSDLFAKSEAGVRMAISRVRSFMQAQGVAFSNPEVDTVYRSTTRQVMSGRNVSPLHGAVDEQSAALAHVVDASPPTQLQRPASRRGMLGRGESSLRMRLKRHRGTKIVLLSGLAIIVSSSALSIALGLIAILMGRKDLDKMRTGRMDASGRNTTLLGVILGIVAVVLAIGGLAQNFLEG